MIRRIDIRVQTYNTPGYPRYIVFKGRRYGFHRKVNKKWGLVQKAGLGEPSWGGLLLDALGVEKSSEAELRADFDYGELFVTEERCVHQPWLQASDFPNLLRFCEEAQLYLLMTKVPEAEVDDYLRERINAELERLQSDPTERW